MFATATTRAGSPSDGRPPDATRKVVERGRAGGKGRLVAVPTWGRGIRARLLSAAAVVASFQLVQVALVVLRDDIPTPAGAGAPAGYGAGGPASNGTASMVWSPDIIGPTTLALSPQLVPRWDARNGTGDAMVGSGAEIRNTSATSPGGAIALEADATGNATRVVVEKQKARGVVLSPLKKDSVRVEKRDFVMRWGFETSPIVIERYRLLFFTVPKVSCSVFKMMFRRMEGCEDWAIRVKGERLHHPKKNGLKYLFNYPLEVAQEMMTSPNWTRAIFLRDPKERLLSAYLNKAVNTNYVAKHCCRGRRKRTNCELKIQTFAGFVEVAESCSDGHWEPQARRVDAKFWGYMNFFGYMDSIAEDTKTMLQLVGGDAWERYGRVGWGVFGNESIYQGPKSWHATDAANQMDTFYSIDLKRKVEVMFKEDYGMFNFTR